MPVDHVAQLARDFGQIARSAHNLEEVADFLNGRLDHVMEQIEHQLDETQKQAAERLSTQPFLFGLGEMLGTLVRMIGPGDTDTMLYQVAFICSTIFVHCERGRDLAGPTLIRGLFDVLLGEAYDSDIRQLAASSLTMLDEGGRLNTDMDCLERLEAFASHVEALLESSSHIGLQTHIMHLLEQCANKTGHTRCREMLRVRRAPFSTHRRRRRARAVPKVALNSKNLAACIRARRSSSTSTRRRARCATMPSSTARATCSTRTTRATATRGFGPPSRSTSSSAARSAQRAANPPALSPDVAPRAEAASNRLLNRQWPHARADGLRSSLSRRAHPSQGAACSTPCRTRLAAPCARCNAASTP
eukprot:7091562-Prymnesium_polylepis.1